MASTISTPSFCCSSSSAKTCKSTMYSSTIPSSSSMYLKTLNFTLSSSFSQMGFCNITPWNGLRHMGISISVKPQKLGNREKCKGKVVYASLFGVGAPEALVIGVVALLVFGPKGLAELARNLGKTLRTFQPTIRELQEVSNEFKSALEREISLDDDPSLVNNRNGSNNTNLTSSQSADPNGAPVPNNTISLEESLRIAEEEYIALTTPAPAEDVVNSPSENQIEVDSQPQEIASPSFAYSSEEYLKITEEQLKASAAIQQNASSSPSENQTEIKSQPQATIEEVATATSLVQKKTESEK